jgi:hypothetical protein
MPDTDQEAQWRTAFETVGHDTVLRGHNFFDESKRKFAVRWLREKEIAREAREKAAHWYTKWTFFAAVAAVIVGIIGVLVTWYWH